MRQLAIAVLLASAVLTLTVCGDATAPPLPADAQQFTPPPVYSTWWEMTKACSGLTGSLSAVSWYQTGEEVHDTRTGDVIAGYWVPGSNRIVLNTLVMMDGGVVRHEMLHALRQKGGHPRGQFLGKCAGTVDCEAQCVADAGPYPPPPETPLQVNGNEMAIALKIQPGTPARNIDEGRFSITVFATNQSSHWVTVAPANGVDALQTFSVDVNGVNGATARDQRGIDPSQTIFAPGEVKRQVFDLMIGDYPFGNQLLPGDYIARGAFAGWSTTNYMFTISP